MKSAGNLCGKMPGIFQHFPAELPCGKYAYEIFDFDRKKSVQ
jgi:hypothetical protein